MSVIAFSVLELEGIVMPIARWSDPISIVCQFSSCLVSLPFERVRSITDGACICERKKVPTPGAL